MASGWNLWIWLPCIGVVSGCCCKEVYRYEVARGPVPVAKLGSLESR